MRKFYFLLVIAVITSLTLVLRDFQGDASTPKKLSKKERIDGAIRDYLFTSSDVDLGIIPYDKLFAAIDEGQRRVNAPSHNRSMSGNIKDAIWRERGPSNRGGRTRAIMIDEGDPAR